MPPSFPHPWSGCRKTELVIDEAAISRVHARIEGEAGTWRIVDVGLDERHPRRPGRAAALAARIRS